jgi:hypothetical protein
MAGYKTEQHHLSHRGRLFHFVSYEGCPPNPRKGELAKPAGWFLMSAGKRWPAIDQVPDQEPLQVVAALTRWLDSHIFIPRQSGD